MGDRSPEIEHKDMVGNTHDNCHIVLYQNLRHAQLLFDIQNDGCNIFRFFKAHSRDRLVQQQQFGFQGQRTGEVGPLL